MNQMTDPTEAIRKALESFDSGSMLVPVEQLRTLLDRLDSAERAIRNVKRVIGPCVPECSGCYEEWSEALRIIDAAIDEQLRSVGEKGPK